MARHWSPPAHGKGLIVLVHVTANADWSNLPLSGLFVDMLRRIVDLAPGGGRRRRRRHGRAAPKQPAFAPAACWPAMAT